MVNQQWVGPTNTSDGPTERAGSSIGVEVEEALFLDEPADYAATAAAQHNPPAFELFADENAFQENDAPAKTAPPQPVRPAVKINLLTLFFVAVATAAFVTVRACQTGGVSLSGTWQFFGR